ncbi:hypothetical protein LTR53_016788 [Teratosphaeriaceae sp. CCFEE 6253]|nr:hypothetical protein LTR53_016788 [Teratosphaeriaceae sp. CCFEE 6253]
MTRYSAQGPPQGQRGHEYQGGEGYECQQQPQYGGNEANYATNNSSENRGYDSQSYLQPLSEGSRHGAAQSYYGSNDQAYQQYSSPAPGNYGGSSEQQQHLMSSMPPASSSSAAYSQAPPWTQTLASEYPPYSQQQDPSRSYYGQSGGDVEAFKSHYEQSFGPLDPGTGQPHASGEEGDRGLMGALAGGAAGAYGGHKMDHGFLGGLGGAVAGSMVEDQYKKRNKKEKKDKKNKHRGSRSSSRSSSSSDSDDEKRMRRHGAAAVMAGNFSASSRGVHLEGATLVAECCDAHGHHRGSRLDLNGCFTNSNGRLQWARGGNFGASSRGMRLTDGGQVFEAELGDGRGGWQYNQVYLNERITNDDGRLHML